MERIKESQLRLMLIDAFVEGEMAIKKALIANGEVLGVSFQEELKILEELFQKYIVKFNSDKNEETNETNETN